MTKAQRLVVVISVLASFVSFLDGSVVSVALPAISKDLGGDLTLQQWVVDAYFITLGSLMLLAGSISDLFGRKRVLTFGLVGFALTSILCALAPNGLSLIIARALQGVAGALLVPSSLALIISAFSGPAQGKAIGIWTGWTGIAFVIGPLLGGFLVDIGSWQMIFLINVLPIALTLWLLRKLKLPELRQQDTKLDIKGAVLGVLGLGGPVYALIEQAHYGWSSPLIYLPLGIGLILFTLFLWYEARIVHPMLPLKLFTIRNFSVGNLATVALYAVLGVMTFLIAIFTQQFGGYTALQAGMALLPVTIIMFFLSSRFGALAGTYGPRLFMAIGPIIGAIGFLALLCVDAQVEYWSQLFPAIILIGLGLAITVAPLTAAVLGSIGQQQAGIGSAVNNAVSRIAGLLAVAGIGVLTGAGAIDLADFHRGALAMAIFFALGGLISAIGIRNEQTTQFATYK